MCLCRSRRTAKHWSELNFTLKLDHDGQIDERLTCADPETKRFSPPPRADSASPRLICPEDLPLLQTSYCGSAAISPGRDNATRARPIRNIGVAIVTLRAKGDVLLGHVVKRDGRIPCLKGAAGVPRKVWRVRGCGGSVAKKR
jgi:hypothetical protein